MPYRGSRGGNLSSRIEAELRERLEEALDAACLDTLVQMRRIRHLPAPVADSARDRAEYETEFRLLLDRLDAHFAPLLGEEGDRPAPLPRPPRDRVGELMTRQVVLARTVPDYWQRFDAVRLQYAQERAASGGESGGLLRRLFGLR